MAINLASLLSMGQAGGSLVETPEQAAERQRLENSIIVNGTQAGDVRQGTGEPEPPYMGNRKYLEEAAMANNEPLPAEVSRQRRGPFGLRGGLRDLIGTLGDALTTANGGDATYAPARQRERLSDAMVGYTASPEAALAAVERTTQVDPVAGRELYDEVNSNRLRESQIAATNAQTQGVNDNRAATRANRFLQNSRRLLAAPEAFINGQLNPQAYRLLESIARQEGMTPADMGITPQMTQEEASMLSQTDISMYQTESLKDRDTQLGIGQYNAETGRINATRPRATPRVANATRASEIARMTRIINDGGTLETGDQAVWDDEMARTDAAAPRAVAPRPPAASTSGLRVVNRRPAN